MSRRRRCGLALGMLWALISVLPVVASARPAEAHPPPSVWIPQWENGIIGYTPVVQHPATQQEVPPPAPVYEYQNVLVSPSWQEQVGTQAVYTSEERCDFDPISGQYYNCRTVQVFSHNEPIYVTHPAVYEQQSVLIGYEPNYITIPAYTSGGDPIYGPVDNGYWGHGPHDDAAPEHQTPDPVDPVDPVDPECTIDPITLQATCPDQTNPELEDQQQNLADFTDDELTALGYTRCPGDVLVTTGELCPGQTEYATSEPPGGCPDGTEWSSAFGGRCVTEEATELDKGCDENGLNCAETTPPIRTWCPAHSSLTSVSPDPVVIDGSEYVVCYFSCDHGDSDLQSLIDDREDYQDDCGAVDEDDPTLCEDGTTPDAQGRCPCPPGESRDSNTGLCLEDCPGGAARDAQGRCPCPSGQSRESDGVCRVPCLPGEVRDPATGNCVTEIAEPPGGCLAGERWDPVNGLCVADVPTCPDGNPEPPGGCPPPTPPTPPAMPSVAPVVMLCRGAADELSITWSWPAGTDTRAVGGWWIDIYGFNASNQPYDYQGTLSVDAASGLVSDNIGSAVVLSHSADGGEVEIPSMAGRKLQVQMQTRDTNGSTTGAVIGRADVEVTDLCMSGGPLVCAMDASEIAAANTQLVWVPLFELEPGRTPRDPYVESGEPRPSRVAMAGTGLRLSTAAQLAIEHLRNAQASDDPLADDEPGCGDWHLRTVQMRWRSWDTAGSAWGSWGVWQPALDVWAQVPEAPGDEWSVGVRLGWEMQTTWENDPHDHDADPLTADITVTETVDDSGSGTYFGLGGWSVFL